MASKKWDKGMAVFRSVMSDLVFQHGVYDFDAMRHVLDNAVEAKPTLPGVRPVVWYEPYCQVCKKRSATARRACEDAVASRDVGLVRQADERWVCAGCDMRMHSRT